MLNKPVSTAIRTTKRHLSRLEHLGVETINDLVHYFPRTYQDNSQFTKVSEVRTDQVNNIKGIISNFNSRRTRNGKLMIKALITDDTGSLEVVWFGQPFVMKTLRAGDEVVLSGKARFAMGKTTLQSPTYEKLTSEGQQVHTGRIIPIYHETEGITSKWMREKLQPLIKDWTSHLHEFLPEEIRRDNKLMDYPQAVTQAHFPENAERLETAKARLAFDELFILQFQALQRKWQWQKIAAKEKKEIAINTELHQEFLQSLPFKLTGAQNRTLEEIFDDLQKPYPMSRLLQGDVGSGKTVVAAAAILQVIKSGYQTALMAPTEILARQHYQTLFKILQPHGINIQFLAGSTTASQKTALTQQLKNGTIDLIVGTHAIIQDKVGFKKLGLAIIDEQHRFGVKQREILKGFDSPHLLALSATPIPRTLAMTLYGDQDLSIIDELPAGRKPIITRIIPETKRIDAYRWIEDQVQKGRQVYVICPLIEESENLDVKSVLDEFERLDQQIFPQLRVVHLHGKMKNEEKDQIMTKFKAGEFDILVSTSVIEVGIDVPNSSIILIEGSERFGLSQLHQFRGRVGRGVHQSYCFLFTNAWSEDTKQRLNAMVAHTSGFKLAEIDLQLRGPGEIYGLRQSGIPDLKMASLTDSETIAKARKSAEKLIEKDPLLNNYPLLKQKIDEKRTEIMVGETKHSN